MWGCIELFVGYIAGNQKDSAMEAGGLWGYRGLGTQGGKWLVDDVYSFSVIGFKGSGFFIYVSARTRDERLLEFNVRLRPTTRNVQLKHTGFPGHALHRLKDPVSCWDSGFGG